MRIRLALIPALLGLNVACGAGASFVVDGPCTECTPVDEDGDGYSPPEDCDDEDASINPGATDIPDDGIDQDCVNGDAHEDEPDEGEFRVVDLYGDTVVNVESCRDIDWEDLCGDLRPDGDMCVWQEFATGAREVWAHYEPVPDLDAEAPDHWSFWTESIHLEGEEALRSCGIVILDEAFDGARQNATNSPDEDLFEEEPWGEEAIEEGVSWTADGQTDDSAALRQSVGAICGNGSLARTQADAWTWTGPNAGTGSHALSVCDDSFDLDILDNE